MSRIIKIFIESQVKKIDFFLSKKKSHQTLFLVFSIFGFIFSFLSRHYLMELPFQFGIEAIALFVPPFLSCIYFSIFGLSEGFPYKLLFESILLFLIQFIPIYDILFYTILPNPGEDFSRNLAYAYNMINNQTLWGGDQIAYPAEGKSFITQPGYRYFLAAEILIFKHLFRFISVVNILFFISTLFLFLKSVLVSLQKSLFRSILVFFLISAVPYATKNILMGLSEWLMVSLLMLSIYFYKVRSNYVLTIIFLALVVFIRQNTLPSVLLMACWVIYSTKNKVLLIMTFLVFLLIPVYHNLYYAGEWKFWVSIHQWPFLKYVSPSKYVAPYGINYLNVLNNVLHYVGIHIRNNGSIDFIEEAFVFLFAFPFLFWFIQAKFLSGYFRLWYILGSFMIIGPTILIGTHFYPRFEFVCIFITIAIFLFFTKDNKNCVIYNSK